MGSEVGGEVVVLDPLDVPQHGLVARDATLNVAELADRHVAVVGAALTRCRRPSPSG
jgi:hypothetical protein